MSRSDQGNLFQFKIYIASKRARRHNRPTIWKARGYGEFGLVFRWGRLGAKVAFGGVGS